MGGCCHRRPVASQRWGAAVCALSRGLRVLERPTGEGLRQVRARMTSSITMCSVPMGSMHASRTLTTMPNNTAHLLPALTLL